MKPLTYQQLLLLNITFILCITLSNTFAQLEGNAYSISSGQSIAVNDETGDIFLAGFTLTEKPGHEPNVYSPDRFRENVFITKFSEQGKQLWLNILPTPEGADITKMLVDASGNVYVTGEMKNSDSSEFDAFLAKYNVEGKEVWLKQFGTSRLDSGVAIALKPTGEIILASITYTN